MVFSTSLVLAKVAEWAISPFWRGTVSMFPPPSKSPTENPWWSNLKELRSASQSASQSSYVCTQNVCFQSGALLITYLAWKLRYRQKWTRHPVRKKTTSNDCFLLLFVRRIHKDFDKELPPQSHSCKDVLCSYHFCASFESLFGYLKKTLFFFARGLKAWKLFPTVRLGQVFWITTYVWWNLWVATHYPKNHSIITKGSLFQMMIVRKFQRNIPRKEHTRSTPKYKYERISFINRLLRVWGMFQGSVETSLEWCSELFLLGGISYISDLPHSQDTSDN